MDQDDDQQTGDGGGAEGDALPADSQDTSDAAALLAEKIRECGEAKDRHLRLYAEFENYKKRTQRDQMDYVKYAAEKVLKELLPVADNLERAIAHARSVQADQTILDGLDLIGRQFRDALQKSGAEPITALGQPFDPAIHQALAQVESTEHEPDTVVEEAQRGYLLHGRILRPALVTVARRPAGE
ncbi:MAG: nucleotide exchange factor GrpE [Nitrospiria bacterium]